MLQPIFPLPAKVVELVKQFIRKKRKSEAVLNADGYFVPTDTSTVYFHPVWVTNITMLGDVYIKSRRYINEALVGNFYLLAP